MGEKIKASKHRTIKERIPDPEEYGPGDLGWTPFARFLQVAGIIVVVIVILVAAHHHR